MADIPDSSENISSEGDSNMKVNESVEDPPPKQDNSPHRSMKTEEFQMCNPSNNPLKSTSTNPFVTDHNKLGKSILKPSLLSFNSSSSTSNNSMIRQSSFNPFNKLTQDNNTNNSDKKQSNGEAVKFVPLVKSETQPHKLLDCPTLSNEVTGSHTASTPSFVFGQNLQDRVTSHSKPSDPLPSTSSINSNGNSSDAEMLFSFTLKSESKPDTTCKEKESKSLTESAKEYEESRANKRKYDEVQVKTGEEDETNILSMSCKLFSFDKASSNWQERGRGTLRLNDYETEDNQIGSRLVFRTSGSLRVILNTKVWAEMTIDKASEKSIRLTALDSSGEIKVFLILSSIEDSRQLFSSLQTRLENEMAAQKRKKLLTETSDK